MKTAIPLMLLLIASLPACHKDDREEKVAPSIDGLTQALQKSADQTLGAPSLANEQLILTVRPEQVDAQAAAVLAAAASAGGVGLRSLDPQGHVSILATIPEANVEIFKAAVRHQPAPAGPAASPSSETRLIEVVILSASPSPTQ